MSQPTPLISWLSTGIKKYKFDSAFILAAITGLSYIASNIYEQRYLAYYGLNSSAAIVELDRMIPTTLAIAVFSVVATYILMRLKKRSDNRKVKFRWFNSMLFILFYILLLLAPMLYTLSPDTFVIDVLMTSVGLILASYILLLMTRFIAWLIGRIFDVNKAKVFKKTVIKVIRTPSTNAGILFIILAVITYSATLPVITASSKERYQVMDYKDVKLVILREYYNEIIAAEINLNNQTLINRYYHIPKSAEPIAYTMENIRLNVSAVQDQKEYFSLSKWLTQIILRQ